MIMRSLLLGKMMTSPTLIGKMMTKEFRVEKMMTNLTLIKKMMTNVKMRTGLGLSRLVILGSASVPVQLCH